MGKVIFFSYRVNFLFPDIIRHMAFMITFQMMILWILYLHTSMSFLVHPQLKWPMNLYAICHGWFLMAYLKFHWLLHHWCLSNSWMLLCWHFYHLVILQMIFIIESVQVILLCSYIHDCKVVVWFLWIRMKNFMVCMAEIWVEQIWGEHNYNDIFIHAWGVLTLFYIIIFPMVSG